jgi:uncharacterized protein (DUF2384 family)
MMEPKANEAVAQEPDALGRVLAAGLKDTSDIARALGASQRSVQRWAAQGSARRPRRDKEARLLELATVLEQANARLPGGSTAAGLWLRAPAEQLGWSAPLDFIRQGRYREVIAILPDTPR